MDLMILRNQKSHWKLEIFRSAETTNACQVYRTAVTGAAIILQYYPEIRPCTLSHCTVVCHNDNPAVLPRDTSLYIKSLYCGVS